METFKALQVIKAESGFELEFVQKSVTALPEGEVTIRVHYSSLNYKDMLAVQGQKGIAKCYPHTPGIDCAGVVMESHAEGFNVGDEVFVTGFGLGMTTSGGFSEMVRVPAAWVLHKPQGLSLYETMCYGTAGLTAAMCVDSLIQVGITPVLGDVLVSGATGAVATFVIMLLDKLDFSVVAATGKTNAKEYLTDIGAAEVIARSELEQGQEKGLLKERWVAAVDTVGGDILAGILKSICYGGSVACCGMAASPIFSASLFPFILRGINLLGVDSAELPMEVRQQMWQTLSDQWRLPKLETVIQQISLEQLPTFVAKMKSGELMGRVVVRLV